MAFPTSGHASTHVPEPEDLDETIEFEDDEEDTAKPLSGRRKKAARDKQKKFKPGSFGACRCLYYLCARSA